MLLCECRRVVYLAKQTEVCRSATASSFDLGESAAIRAQRRSQKIWVSGGLGGGLLLRFVAGGSKLIVE